MARLSARKPVTRPLLAVLVLVPPLLLAACGVGQPRVTAFETEAFDSTTTHTRSFAATEAQTCEAARRALLSQGYVVSRLSADEVAGRKQFQPLGDIHVDVDFRVVCARDQRSGEGSIAFATAVQEQYELKKANSSASLGVGAIGSVSLPFTAGNDAMVKVASRTLTDDEFYTRFYVLMEEFLYVPAAPTTQPVAPAPTSSSSAPRDEGDLRDAESPWPEAEADAADGAAPAEAAEGPESPALFPAPAPPPLPELVPVVPSPSRG